MKKNALIGFMFVFCALFGFNNYDKQCMAQTYVTPGTTVTYSYTQVPNGPLYSIPSTVRVAPIRNFIGGVAQAAANASQPRYLPGPTVVAQAQSVPQATYQYQAPQPKYQQVTETRYRKVCRGRAGCTYEPYTYTYMKRVQ